MGRILSFNAFINEAMSPRIASSYSVSEEDWEAMRIVPERGIPDELSHHYRGGKAKDLVEKTINMVSQGVFKDPPEIAELMLNIAAVESCYGTNPNTYKRPDQTKGVFQLDKNSALATIGYKGVKPKGNIKIRNYVKEAKIKVKNKLDLDWDLVPYESLSKLLYNVIAARIFIGLRTKSYGYDKSTNKISEKSYPVPKTKEEQAKWWKDRYNTSSGDGTEEKFLNPPGCSL